MKANRFFIATLLLVAIAIQVCSAQRYLSENVNLDIALVKCQTVQISRDLVQVNFTLRNNGKSTCKLADKNGDSLVNFSIDGSSNKAPTLDSFDGSARLAPQGITIKITELGPGETATGSFTFDYGVWNHEEQLVSYLVTLDTERLGDDLNLGDNAVCGLVGK